MSVASSIEGNHMFSFEPCFRNFFELQLSGYNKATIYKIYYYVHKYTLVIEKNLDDINSSIFFLMP